MAITNNPIDSVSTLPSLAALQRRRNELNAYQSWQRSQQTSAPLAEQEPELEEESSGSPNLEFPTTNPMTVMTSKTLHTPKITSLLRRSLQLRPHWRIPPSTALPVSSSALSLPTPKPIPAAVLLQFLAAFGNLVGPAPHCLVSVATRPRPQPLRHFVGESSKARKGTSWREISSLFARSRPRLGLPAP